MSKSNNAHRYNKWLQMDKGDRIAPTNTQIINLTQADIDHINVINQIQNKDLKDWLKRKILDNKDDIVYVNDILISIQNTTAFAEYYRLKKIQKGVIYIMIILSILGIISISCLSSIIKDAPSPELKDIRIFNSIYVGYLLVWAIIFYSIPTRFLNVGTLIGMIFFFIILTTLGFSIFLLARKGWVNHYFQIAKYIKTLDNYKTISPEKKMTYDVGLAFFTILEYTVNISGIIVGIFLGICVFILLILIIAYMIYSPVDYPLNRDS